MTLAQVQQASCSLVYGTNVLLNFPFRNITTVQGSSTLKMGFVLCSCPPTSSKVAETKRLCFPSGWQLYHGDSGSSGTQSSREGISQTQLVVTLLGTNPESALCIALHQLVIRK